MIHVTTDFPDRSFDVGLLIHIIEHIDDPDFLLSSLQKLVNTLIVEVPDFESDSLNLVRLKLGSPYYSDETVSGNTPSPLWSSNWIGMGGVPAFPKVMEERCW
jgi:hypothetical protein